MIASFAHDFIFVRTRKTASTTTEIIIGAWCGPDDIVGPVGLPEHELLRAEYGGGRAQNFCSDPGLQKLYYRKVAAGNLKGIERVKRQMQADEVLQYSCHMKAKLIRKALPDLWARAYKFAVDRHPYEKVLSRAWNGLLSKYGGHLDRFEELSDTIINDDRAWNYQIYMDNGEVIVDKLFRFNEIWAELERLSRQLGKSMPPALPLARGEHPRPPAPAAEMLTAEQKRRIYDAVGIEFELFGWDR